MGNNCYFEQKNSTVQFYTQIEDKNLGKVEIYKKIDTELHYILKYEQKCQDSNIYNKFTQIEKLQSSCLLKMHGFYVQRLNCCRQLNKQKIVSYWDYYNIYFDDYLNKRSKMKCLFLDNEFWYVVQVCCEAFIIFKKLNIIYEIDTSKFVVTMKGKLKTFWSHIKNKNRHLKFIQHFEKNENIDKFYFSPQQINYMMKNQNATTKIDFEKCNSFRLGMILFRCLSMTILQEEPLNICYNSSMTNINFSFIKKIIHQKIKPKYPTDIIKLLESLLDVNPSKRPSLLQVFQLNQKRFSEQFELRVCENTQKLRKIQQEHLQNKSCARVTNDHASESNSERTVKLKLNKSKRS